MSILFAVFLDVFRPALVMPGKVAPLERFELIALAVTKPGGAFPELRRLVNAETALDWFEPLTDEEQAELARRLELAGRIAEDEEQRQQKRTGGRA